MRWALLLIVLVVISFAIFRPTSRVATQSVPESAAEVPKTGAGMVAEKVAPEIKPPPTKRAVEIASPTETLPADLEDSLREGREVSDQWENSREEFLKKDLSLSSDQWVAIEKLRAETLQTEESLNERPVANSEENALLVKSLEENRERYEAKVSEVMGKDRWGLYLRHFQNYWKLSEERSSSLHATLK